MLLSAPGTQGLWHGVSMSAVLDKLLHTWSPDFAVKVVRRGIEFPGRWKQVILKQTVCQTMRGGLVVKHSKTNSLQ